MRINYLPNYNFYQSGINKFSPSVHRLNPAFKSYSERKSCKDYTFLTDTLFFRDDMDWENFVEYIDNNYKNTPKVNIICHACSDGEEPYSLALKLISKLGKKAEKFFPIIAKDIDSDNIQKAKDGIFRISKTELRNMKIHSNNNLDKYFHIVYHNDEYIYAAAKPTIKSKIIFEQSNILEDIDSIKPGNTILLCRNFWPYIKPEEKAKELASKICSKLGLSDIVVIGYYDMFSGLAHKLLYDNGFVGTDIRCVFRHKNIQKQIVSFMKR